MAAVKLPERDHRGLKDVVIDMVTFGRHTKRDAALLPMCALARNGGFCHVHGFAKDWGETVRPGEGASEEEKDAAWRRRNGNCLSCANGRSTGSSPASEALGINLLMLRLLWNGFWVTAFAHDQDAGSGITVRYMFPEALECLDRSHIQVGKYQHFVVFKGDIWYSCW